MTSNSIIIVVILVLYMGGMLYIGQRGKKYAKTMKDFLTGGKQGSLFMVAGSYLGAHVGTGIVIGGATYGATYGIGGAWYGIGAALSFVLFGLFCAKWAYRGGYLTIPTYFRERYKDTGKIMTLAWALLGSCVAITTITGQIIAGRQLFTYIGIDPLIGCIVAVVIIYIYCTAAGMWGVMMTDFWQCAIIFLGLVTGIAIIFGGGHGTAAIGNLEPSYFNPVPFDIKTLTFMVVPTALYGLTGGASMQRTASAKSENVAFKGALLGGVLTACFTFLPIALGMFGMGAYADADPSTVIFQVIMTEMPVVVAGLLMAAIVAAVMSTCDTTIMTIVTNIVYDCYSNVLAPKFGWTTEDRKLRRGANYVTIFLCVSSLLLSFQFNSIISVMASGYTMFAAGGMVPFLGARLWKRGTGIGALSSMATGMLVAWLDLVNVIDLPTGMLCLIPAAVVYVIVSLLTQPKNVEPQAA